MGIIAEVTGFSFLNPDQRPIETVTSINGTMDRFQGSNISILGVIHISSGAFPKFPVVTKREAMFIGLVSQFGFGCEILPNVAASVAFRQGGLTSVMWVPEETVGAVSSFPSAGCSVAGSVLEAEAGVLAAGDVASWVFNWLRFFWLWLRQGLFRLSFFRLGLFWLWLRCIKPVINSKDPLSRLVYVGGAGDVYNFIGASSGNREEGLTIPKIESSFCRGPTESSAVTPGCGTSGPVDLVVEELNKGS